MTRWVGQSLRRKEDERLLRGQGRYVADISLAGQVHVAFLRSPHAHAMVERIDTAGARELAGVVDVLTSRDVPEGPMPPFLWDRPPSKVIETLRPHLRPSLPPLLASDRVMFAGQALAIVVAENRYVAEDALERIDVEFAPLPVLASVQEALAPGAPAIHEGWDDNVAVRFTVAKGDVDEALASADVVVTEHIEVQRQAGMPLETRGTVAAMDGDRLTLWSSTQNPHPLQRAMSQVADLPVERVRVIAPDVGGGFGTKGVLYPEDLLVGLLAMRLGRPVKWIEDRLEHFQSAIHAREQDHTVSLGFSEDGRLLAMQDVFSVDAGAFNALGLVIPYNTVTHLMGPYRVPAFRATATGVITNKVPTAPYRGAGRPEAVFAVERTMDVAARRLGIDRVELRRRNLLPPKDLPYATGIDYRDGEPMVLDSGDYPETLDRAVALVGWDDATADRDARIRGGRRKRVGVGVAAYVEGTGIGPYEGARVTLDTDGRIGVRTGAASQGQGHQTVFSQIVADELGVDPAEVDVVGGDTEGLEKGWGTVASRSAVVAGNAIGNAAVEVRDRALNLASQMLEAAAEDFVITDGRVHVRGASDRNVGLTDVAARAKELNAPISVESYFEPPTVTWANGVHAAIVEVDLDTGEVEILRYAVVHDCGTVINPTIVDGQIRGGVAQGVGGAMYEEIVYSEDAQILTATLADYLMPTSGEVPPVLLEHLESPSPANPRGIKGVGEGGAIPGAAVIANAVEDALWDLGVRVRRTPLSPLVVRTLLEDAGVS